MSRFDEIEIFASVVEAGNITRAAKKRGLSKSRVSEMVMTLEARLGVRLLDRNTRRVSPTEEGAMFYERCRRAIDEVDSGEAEMLARQDVPSGHLRIGSPEGFADRHLVPALAQFLQLYPCMTAELVEDQRSVSLIEQGLDMTVRVVREPDPALIVRRLATSRILICASPALLLQHGIPDTPEAAADLPTIGFSSLSWAREWSLVRGSDARTVAVRPLVLCNSTVTLRKAAIAGLGVTAIPQWAVSEELESGRLVRVLQEWKLPESGIFAVYPSNRLITAKVRRFVDILAPLLRRSLEEQLGKTASLDPK
jgi:DNA-binding transcriptional LysR family regulator